MMKYETYKDSGIAWLGLENPIPSHWKVERVKDMGTFRSGDFISALNMDIENSYPVYGGNGFRGFSKNYNHNGDYILIGRQGALCGNINYASDKFWATEHAVVVYKRSNANIKWLGELLKIMNLNQYSLSAAQPGLSVDRIKRLELPVPPSQEQKAIAQYLDNKTQAIDKKVSLLQKKIDYYTELRKSIINDAVTKGLDKNVELKNSGIDWIGQIPKHWEVLRIKDYTYLKARIGWQGLRSDEFVDNTDWHCVTGTDFKNGVIDWSNCYCVEKDRYDQDSKIQLKENDLLITKDGSIGKLAIVNSIPKKATLNSGVFVSRPLKAKYINQYMFWILSSRVFSYFNDYTKNGTTILHLYQNVFERFIYSLPPKKEQIVIANYLNKKTDTIDAIITSIGKQIEHFKELRKTLINDVVTGKIKVAPNN